LKVLKHTKELVALNTDVYFTAQCAATREGHCIADL